MVDATTTEEITVTVPGFVESRVRKANRALNAARDRLLREQTVEHTRMVAAGNREVAAAYRALASSVRESEALSIGLRILAYHHIDKAVSDEEFADWLEAREARGEGRDAP